MFGLLLMMAIPGKDETGVDLRLLGKLLAPAATALGKQIKIEFEDTVQGYLRGKVARIRNRAFRKCRM